MSSSQLSEKQRSWIAKKSEIATLVFEDDRTLNVDLGCYYLSELSWDTEKVKTLVQAMQEYGGLESHIRSIRAAWRAVMMRKPTPPEEYGKKTIRSQGGRKPARNR
jgi:hypothetical protein